MVIIMHKKIKFTIRRCYINLTRFMSLSFKWLSNMRWLMPPHISIYAVSVSGWLLELRWGASLNYVSYQMCGKHLTVRLPCLMSFSLGGGE